jgi:hypothetical protein
MKIGEHFRKFLIQSNYGNSYTTIVCMGGCGVRGVFSVCVRRFLLNIMSWGRSFSYKSSFFIQP